MTESSPSSRWSAGAILIFIVIPLVAGCIFALLIPQPIIGVIHLKDAIDGNTGQEMITQIIYAREHPEVKAVVLIVNSPGGTVTDTESVYMELSRLRQTKPVITMVEGMAASGAYYIAVGSDYIYSKPSSEVGNIGIIGYLPPPPSVYDEIYSTGPYKLWGTPRDSFIRNLDVLKRGFLSAVLLGRGKALKAAPTTILTGEIWSGTEALSLGLIDDIGTQSQAFDKAAALAHISNYKVEDLKELAEIPSNVVVNPFFSKAPDGHLTPYPNQEGIYYLYIPPAENQP